MDPHVGSLSPLYPRAPPPLLGEDASGHARTTPPRHERLAPLRRAPPTRAPRGLSAAFRSAALVSALVPTPRWPRRVRLASARRLGDQRPAAAPQ